IAPGLIPNAITRAHGAPPLDFEAAAVIVTPLLLGQLLARRARERTSGAIRALVDLAPNLALRVRTDGTYEDSPVLNNHVGDALRVRPGEKVRVDGRLVEGRAALDESLVTGESLPVTKQAGDSLIAGSLNTTGGFVMQAEK